MRFIIRNKVYDTNKMELVGHVRKRYAIQNWLERQIYGDGMSMMYDCELYRSEKGNFLLLRRYGSSVIGQAIEETEAKDLLMRHDYDSYVRLYGELEEA